MPLDKKLLEILCCPVTKTPVTTLPEGDLERINELISEGKVAFVDGTAVESPLDEGLITDDRKVIYSIDDGIPVMLQERGIETAQLPSD